MARAGRQRHARENTRGKRQFSPFRESDYVANPCRRVIVPPTPASPTTAHQTFGIHTRTIPRSISTGNRPALCEYHPDTKRYVKAVKNMRFWLPRRAYCA